jgi:hypothetical protein
MRNGGHVSAGRHLREGREPTFEEAELIITISAALCSYLVEADLGLD